MSLLKKIITISNKLTSSARLKVFSNYPKLNFENHQLENLVSLKDRSELLRRLPKNAIIAEIGVYKGDFSEKILSICHPEKFTLIDVWNLKGDHGELFDEVKQRFAKELQTKQVEMIRSFSYDAIHACPDQYFDWVYLDTDHSYEVTRRELEELRPKMKRGGIIAGHDYILGNWNAGFRYGVIEAVREFCVKYNWEMIYLTHELDTHPSFAIRECNIVQ
ncbi:MAG TPA: class I SAM-dependent methyltransferase [Saprospiraceae bacterium]|nr:class I SAM-dependent methyltransferase [Saprospiraceae bacterium]